MWGVWNHPCLCSDLYTFLWEKDEPCKKLHWNQWEYIFQVSSDWDDPTHSRYVSTLIICHKTYFPLQASSCKKLDVMWDGSASQRVPPFSRASSCSAVNDVLFLCSFLFSLSRIWLSSSSLSLLLLWVEPSSPEVMPPGDDDVTFPFSEGASPFSVEMKKTKWLMH